MVGRTLATVRHTLLLAAVLLATAAVYRPVLEFGYVLYDDDVYVSENHRLRDGLTVAGASWALTADRGATWQPLVWFSYLADVSACGLRPGCFHGTNLALHLANVALFFVAAMTLLGHGPWALLAAALFAFHPIHVEAVAWISARKDVLSTLLFLLSVIAYVGHARRPSAPRYLLSLLFFALGLLAKPMLVSLPLLLLVLDYWPLGRINGGSEGDGKARHLARSVGARLVEKVPFLLLALCSSVVTYLVQSSAGAVGGVGQFPLMFRLFNAALSYGAYLRKLAWPMDLAAAYQMPVAIPWGEGLLALAVLTLGAGLVLAGARKAPWLFAGLSWFMIALLPVIQLIPIGGHAMADRFAYIPFMGLYLGLPGMLAAAPRGATSRTSGALAAAAFVFLCAVVSRRQVSTWRDTRTLFERTLAVDPGNYLAHNNIGVYLARGGAVAEAAGHFEEALRLSPTYREAADNLSRARSQLRGEGWR